MIPISEEDIQVSYDDLMGLLNAIQNLKDDEVLHVWASGYLQEKAERLRRGAGL